MYPGERIVLSMRKAEVLLAYLALAPGIRHPRERLTNLGETQVVTHDFGNAIKTTEWLVAQDPLGESGWRLLMRSYHGHSDRSHALMAFKRCNEVLQKELGVEPGAETRELWLQIKQGKPEVDKPAHDIVGKSVEIPQEPVAETRAQENSIAVLPFDNLSGDPEQEYFSDGITTSIILGLGMYRDLTVKSRQSSFAFRDSGKPSEEIAKQQFESCLKIDPDNAMAHTNLGNVHIVEIIENWSSDWEESNRLAGFHADKVIELNPTMSEGYAV